MCHAKNCSAVKHPSSVTRNLIPSHAYLVLPGPHILHPLPLFNYKHFSEPTLLKLLYTSITNENVAYLRSSTHTPPNMLSKPKESNNCSTLQITFSLPHSIPPFHDSHSLPNYHPPTPPPMRQQQHRLQSPHI